jgi:hypothetical protein
MFVRFRQTPSRLQVSLVETRRALGKVRHEHVASLGSIIVSPPVADRIVFWARLHERLAKLSNRIGAELLGKILGDIHARVPMVTPDEQRALQLENARTDAAIWSGLRDLDASGAADWERFVAKLGEQIASAKERAAKAEGEAKAAETRVAAIERGETIEGGLGKPLDVVAFLKSNGWTEADLRHARLLASVPKKHEEEFWQEPPPLVRTGRPYSAHLDTGRADDPAQVRRALTL